MINLIIEIIAVISAILYLLLAAKEDVKCWYAVIISSSLYFYIMYDAGLIMEAYLQIFYILMALYGWFKWTKSIQINSNNRIRTLSNIKHFITITSVVILAVITGFILKKYTNAALPFLDAFTSWGAIITTYMVAQKILENWIYWFVIDSISIYIFLSRELYLTALLFFIYLIIICFGYASWRKKYFDTYDS
tara:strand:- start:209 stop:784 length:576 start_codon:yes stop_codon:yes gene_type:complete